MYTLRGMKKVMFKWSKDLDEIFSKEEIQIATSICKDVQHHSSLGKCEQNQNEIPPHSH